MKKAPKNNNSKSFMKTYNVPLSLPSAFYDFLDTLEINENCRRGMIGLYKYVAASILRLMQLEINEDCREKGKILKKALENKMEERPKYSNAYYRKLFQDGSKHGAISNYLIKNAIMGQYRHVNGKFTRLREILKGCSFSSFAQFVMCNYIDRDLRQQISNMFHWKLSHVRPQMRGFRRLMERSKNFDDRLRLYTKNEEFMKLRAEIDTLVKSNAKSMGLNVKIIEKILNRFQKYHALHVLLLSTEKLQGIYPKIMKIDGKKYGTKEIEKQMNALQKFCHDNRKQMEVLVAKNITGVVEISASEIPTVLHRVIKEQGEYVKFLKENDYGTYHAKRKMKALLALQSNSMWIKYLKYGTIPSERYHKSLAKLVNAISGIRVKTESALSSVVPELFLNHFLKEKSIKKEEFIDEFLKNLTADDCVNTPFTSPHNRKKYSPIDLTPLNHRFLIIRPCKNTQELLDEYFRDKRPIPLRIAPGKIISFYSNSETGKIFEETLKEFVRKILVAKKKYTPQDIDSILELLSFNGINYLSRHSLINRIGHISKFAAFLLNPILEINLFTNRRIKSGLRKIKEIIKNPKAQLSPVRILSLSDSNDTCECQLIFKSSEEIPEFKRSTRFMDDMEIGTYKKDEIMGIDINQENEHKMYVAPDWKTTEAYIKNHKLERKLKRKIYNEDRDKFFTTYVNNSEDSILVSDRINALSGELRKNVNHLKALKKHKKRVQGSIGKKKFHSIAITSQLYKDIMNLDTNNGETRREIGEFEKIAQKVRDIPKNEVHELRRLRNERNALIESIIDKLRDDSRAVAEMLLGRYTANKESGKELHRVESEFEKLQKKIENIRKEIKCKLEQLNAMIVCENHPGKMVYEDLNVKHQGLKGVLGEITKYMPDMSEMVSNIVEILDQYSKKKGKKIRTKIYATHPGGSSSPPHIPTGLDFQRGGKNGWNVVKIPAQVKDKIRYPQLKVNTHVLACQKLCEKVRVN